MPFYPNSRALLVRSNNRTTPIRELLNRLALLSWILLTCSSVDSLRADPPAETPAALANDLAPLSHAKDNIVLPKPLPDPLEPANRVIWKFNNGIMTYFAKPLSRAYRFVVAKPVRTSIANFGRNISYPGRLLNNGLQGNWKGAGHESERFFCNTVVGVGGFFDVATKWEIPKSDNDFGRTFSHWGWRPRFFLVLPIFGPSNDRDATALLSDAAANPLTYFAPYTYATYGTGFNNLTGTVDDYVRFNRTEMDAYSVAQYAGAFSYKSTPAISPDKGSPDQAAVETVQSVFFTFNDPEFANRGKTRAALIPATGKKLKFTFWMQPKPAPIIYIVPGLGAHRLANTTLALSELAYENGFSVVSISSAFNAEFMENAATTALPAYAPVDARDLHVALTEIDHQLESRYPHRLEQRTLLGYSLGGFHTLMIAGNAATSFDTLLKFDRYVAIDPPVRLMHGMSQLDELYQAPLAWPENERTEMIENVLSKAAAVTKAPPAPHSSMPFDATESSFLIGAAFRLTLRDVIFSSQQRNDQKVLTHSVKNLRRSQAYQEILKYSYHDYFEKFVRPYYLTRNLDLNDSEILDHAADLRTYSDNLKTNSNIRLIVNRNDILLAAEDITWFEQTFEPARLALFEKGGHLGNLSQPEVQTAIVAALSNSKTSKPVLANSGKVLNSAFAGLKP